MKKPTRSVVIRASAGSGKTYQLTLRFIALMALGVRPSEIIALTFTRKAAAEFTERILHALAESAMNEETARSMSQRIKATWFGSQEGQPGLLGDSRSPLPDMNREFFQDLLQSFTREWGKLNLGTLDSFFGKLTRALSHDWTNEGSATIDEVREVQLRVKVLSSLFDLRNKELEGKQELIDAFRLATLNAENDRIDRAMAEFVKNYHRKFSQLPDEENWGNMNRLYGTGSWPPPVLNPDEFEEKALSLIPLIEKVDASQTWKKERVAMMQRFIAFGRSGATFKVPGAYAPGAPFWTNVKNKSFVEIYRNKEIDLGGVLGQGIADLITSWSKILIAAATARTRGIYQLIKSYDCLYEEEVRSHGLLTFDDITRLLLKHISHPSDDSGWEDLHYHMDGWYKHWMLDEFQDTSTDQWQIIKPFLEEIAMDPEGDRSLFIVGDPKQSIYQWRGGEPRIFDHLIADEPWHSFLSLWDMDSSYRSSVPVLDFANLVCDFRKSASSYPTSALERWHYHSHKAGGANRNLTGHVQVWQLPEKKKSEREIPPEYPALTTLLQRLDPLAARLSCAVLMNDNKEVVAMAEWLKSVPGGAFPVNMDSSFHVGNDSPLGTALSDFFQWLNHPADEFAWNHIAHSPLSLFLEPASEDLFSRSPEKAWMYWREILDNEGIIGILNHWEASLSRHPLSPLNPFLQARLSDWMDCARQFDTHGGTLDEWITFMEYREEKKTTSSDSIQLMTIHKSKGLEFDTVILPSVKSSGFDDKKHMNLISRKDEWGRTRAFIINPGKESYEYDPILRELVGEWSSSQTFEGFCKLYVALTRAKRATYVFLPFLSPSSEKNYNPAGIIRTACRLQGGEWNDNLDGKADSCLYESGNSEWFLADRDRKPFTQNNEAKLSLIAPVTRQTSFHQPSRSIPDHTYSAWEERTSSDARRRGKRLHILFEQVEWLEKTLLPDFLINDATPEAKLVKDCLSRQEIRDLFIKPEGENIILWREVPVTGFMEGTCYSGVIDRVSIQDDQAVLIDYKSSQRNEREILNKYSNQLKIYADLLIKSFSNKKLKVKAYIILIETGKLIPVL